MGLTTKGGRVYMEVPEEGVEYISDGYHTFKDLYHQRLILTAALCKLAPGAFYKTTKDENGNYWYGHEEPEWFLISISTTKGEYTYHYEMKDWDLFDCAVLDKANHWDGHTFADVERLLHITGY